MIVIFCFSQSRNNHLYILQRKGQFNEGMMVMVGTLSYISPHQILLILTIHFCLYIRRQKLY